MPRLSLHRPRLRSGHGVGDILCGVARAVAKAVHGTSSTIIHDKHVAVEHLQQRQMPSVTAGSGQDGVGDILCGVARAVAKAVYDHVD